MTAASDGTGLSDRLNAARDKLEALVSRWRARHPAAALDRIERYVRSVQGLAPIVEGPPEQRPDLFRYPGLTARPWHERDEFPWIPTLEDRWQEVRAELDALLARPDSFVPFVD